MVFHTLYFRLNARSCCYSHLGYYLPYTLNRMINLRQLLHSRVIWQQLSIRKNRQDILTTFADTFWKHYIRSCSQLPSSRENNKARENDVLYFRNLLHQLHDRCNENPAEHESEPTESKSDNKKLSITSARNSNDRNIKGVSDYMTQQNHLSDNSDPSASTFDVLNPLAKGDVKLCDVPTNFPPSFNFAAYVNKSTVLQQLVRLGVDISKWDEKKDMPEYILKLDFEKDIQTHIQFLHDHGVSASELGKFLTKNPLIFQQKIDDLKVRINYLESKNFSFEAIARILTKAPYFLMFGTRQIDHRLGFLQKEFQLTGDELRTIVTRLPKLPLQNLLTISKMQFAIKEEMGFNRNEIKCLILSKPKLWLLEKRSLLERFQYIHNEMGLSHDMIAKFPEALLSRKFIINQRHLYLQTIGRAQYDPTKEGYVTLKAVVCGRDSEFCATVAKTSVKKFNEFLKTL